jgi:hypothetical protein
LEKAERLRVDSGMLCAALEVVGYFPIVVTTFTCSIVVAGAFDGFDRAH